jgi:branched-chain amino acid transport system ATP-binding protein
MLNTISGFLSLRAGAIAFEGERIDGLSPDRIVRGGIVQVPQGREVFATMTVKENLVHVQATFCLRGSRCSTSK